MSVPPARAVSLSVLLTEIMSVPPARAVPSQLAGAVRVLLAGVLPSLPAEAVSAPLAGAVPSLPAETVSVPLTGADPVQLAAEVSVQPAGSTYPVQERSAYRVRVLLPGGQFLGRKTQNWLRKNSSGFGNSAA
jgi:hypothetical protein